MPAAELFTVATRPTPGLARLQRSLSRFGVPITVLGANEPEYWGHGWRWKTFITAVKASSADTVLHCDGYDSVCLGPLEEIVAKFESLGHSIVFAFELQKQPEFWLGLQAGLMVADRNALRGVFDDKTLEELFPDHFNDQYQIQSMYSWNPAAFILDTQGVIFYTQCPCSPDLVVENNRLINPITGIAPSFVHAPNHGDLSNVEAWLAASN